ncbi:uncharacterized protein LOC103575136 [Microplitis demolitor]|uniref:uncharacterized protein LOC103575136 n=1 Tax=Microplitis demolitor TaxID=69319 RepID=UPI0004CD42CC|nr:uncharacterized protein LOC103575136 [Microplitis demolitor]
MKTVNHCCCFGLSTASILIGLLNIIFLKFVIYAVIAFRRQLDFCELFNFILPFCADYINRLDSISTFIVIKYVAAIMMMVGSDQKIHQLMWPHLVVHFIEISITILFMIYYVLSCILHPGKHNLKLLWYGGLFVGVWLSVNIHFWIVINSRVKEIKRQKHFSIIEVIVDDDTQN